MKFKAFVRYDKNFSRKDQAKLARATFIWEQVFNSKSFADRVKNYSFKLPGGQVHTGFFSYATDPEKNPSRIYDLLLKANEHKYNQDGYDYEADVFLNLDTKQVRGVLGYTYPNSKFQWIYSWFFNSASPEDIAMNLAHEYCHKLGFDHTFNKTKYREHSVPYAIGYLVKELYQNEPLYKIKI